MQINRKKDNLVITLESIEESAMLYNVVLHYIMSKSADELGDLTTVRFNVLDDLFHALQ